MPEHLVPASAQDSDLRSSLASLANTRQPTDQFGDLVRQHAWPQPDVCLIRELRDDLRRIVEHGGPASQQEPAAADDCLNRWIARVGVRVTVSDGKVSYGHDAGPAGEFLVAVISAVATGTWSRREHANLRAGEERVTAVSRLLIAEINAFRAGKKATKAAYAAAENAAKAVSHR